MRGKYFRIILLILITFQSYAQKIKIGQAEIREDSTLNDKPEKFKTRFTPFIAPSISPETEFMLIFGGLLSFKFEPFDKLINQSSVPFSIGYSTNKSLLINFRPYLYFNRDKYRLYGNIWVKNMPDNYFGVGYDLNSTIPLGKETTQYQRKWWQVDFRFLREIKKSLYAGLVFDFNSTVATELNSKMAEDTNILEDGTNIHNRGLGINIEFDSRDMPVNAYKGLLLNFSSTFYGDYLGTDYNYTIVVLDYRQYKTIKREGSTLAWQIKNRTGIGSVPWPELAQLGTPFDLRGYRWGQYRDRQMTFGIVEYRFSFLRKNPDKNGRIISKHGLVTWVGAGTVSPEIGFQESWLPNAGMGYRFEIQPRMNARLDFGIGKNSTGIYVSFNEAF